LNSYPQEIVMKKLLVLMLLTLSASAMAQHNTDMVIGPGATVVAGVGQYQPQSVAYWSMRPPDNQSTFSPIQSSFNSNRFTHHKLIPVVHHGPRCTAQTAPSAELEPAPNKPRRRAL